MKIKKGLKVHVRMRECLFPVYGEVVSQRGAIIRVKLPSMNKTVYLLEEELQPYRRMSVR